MSWQLLLVEDEASVREAFAMRLSDHGYLVQTASSGEDVLLRTTSFEAFRWRFGRRSRDQLLAMDWSGDPGPFLPHLCVFGPADHDLVE